MRGLGLVTIGQTMAVIRSRTERPLEHGARLGLSFAGAETNVAIGMRRLGIPATWIGHLGPDALADMIRRELRAEGVQARVRVDPDRPTGLILSEQRTSGTTRIWYYRKDAAGVGLSAADVDGTLVAAASLLHVTGILLCLGPGPAEAVTHAVELARAAGVPVSVDLNYRSALATPEEFAQLARPLIAAADIVFATADEAALLTGLQDPADMAKALHAAGPPTVVIKSGADGSLLSCPDGRFRRDAIAVRVVDTVGAGDAFAAGFLAAFLAGHDAEQQIDQAVRVAGFSVASDGDWEGLPSAAELVLHSGKDVLR
ncbi:sugar kinase [Catenulispora yoronensis]|uniref:Sugar kinase n=1 Tax=Catenulispora yoronensis TaxID=450799 RepID=A0ABN2TSY1_9ACTN